MKLTHQAQIDRLVLQRLDPLTPFYMEDENKWLVMFANEWEYEVERFATQDEARQFIATLKGQQHDK